jgi:hypothetical protein
MYSTANFFHLITQDVMLFLNFFFLAFLRRRGTWTVLPHLVAEDPPVPELAWISRHPLAGWVQEAGLPCYTWRVPQAWPVQPGKFLRLAFVVPAFKLPLLEYMERNVACLATAMHACMHCCVRPNVTRLIARQFTDLLLHGPKLRVGIKAWNAMRYRLLMNAVFYANRVISQLPYNLQAI